VHGIRHWALGLASQAVALREGLGLFNGDTDRDSYRDKKIKKAGSRELREVKPSSQ
jgi:hypothetical protein